MTYLRRQLDLPGGPLTVLQPDEAAGLPDDGAVEWAPLVPYWSVLWRSGVALAQELADAELRDSRVVELGCGLGLPSLVAARAGADVLATDADGDALDLLEPNARENGLTLRTARIEWAAPDDLVASAPFDMALAADVLYERSSVAPLLSLLPRLGGEVWLADPGRPTTSVSLEQASTHWSVATLERGVVRISRLRPL